MSGYRQQWVLPDLQLWTPEPAPLETVCGTLAAPRSIAFFCTATGELWGRRIITNSAGIVQPWAVAHVLSPGQPPSLSQDFPGTVLGYLTYLVPLETIPLPVLVREFSLLYSEQMDTIT